MPLEVVQPPRCFNQPRAVDEDGGQHPLHLPGEHFETPIVITTVKVRFLLVDKKSWACLDEVCGAVSTLLTLTCIWTASSSLLLLLLPHLLCSKQIPY